MSSPRSLSAIVVKMSFPIFQLNESCIRETKNHLILCINSSKSFFVQLKVAHSYALILWSISRCNMRSFFLIFQLLGLKWKSFFPILLGVILRATFGCLFLLFQLPGFSHFMRKSTFPIVILFGVLLRASLLIIHFSAIYPQSLSPFT